MFNADQFRDHSLSPNHPILRGDYRRLTIAEKDPTILDEIAKRGRAVVVSMGRMFVAEFHLQKYWKPRITSSSALISTPIHRYVSCSHEHYSSGSYQWLQDMAASEASAGNQFPAVLKKIEAIYHQCHLHWQQPKCHQDISPICFFVKQTATYITSSPWTRP